MISFWSLFVLPLALVAAQSAENRQLVALAEAGNGVIRLNPKVFDILISPKRTWSATIQLTALDGKRKCAPCGQFNPSYNDVARSWARVPQEHRDEHFFATLDFDEGPTVFEKLGIQAAPIVYVYPPAKGPRAVAGKTEPFTYDFSNGFDPAPLAESLSRHTPIPIPYKSPIDWTRWTIFTIAALSFLIALPQILPYFQNRWMWALGSIGTSLVMSSGYMFTRIRGSPYTGPNGQWIAGGYQNQYGQEVQIIAFIYGLLSFSFILLIVIIPRQQSGLRQRFQVYIWTAVIVVMNSLLVSIFRVKNRGYPFKLLF